MSKQFDMKSVPAFRVDASRAFSRGVSANEAGTGSVFGRRYLRRERRQNRAI